ncbi:MAG: hypothetical protein JXR78_01510 [Victivallales bacterium]|nr:hypothetical protein [Victivallales bacterium]
MIKIKDPRQTEMLDRFSVLLGPAAYRRMKEGWQGCFRECILYLRLEVVGKLAKDFSKLPGSETKELFSMAGLMVIKDFFNWTNEEAIARL